MNHHLQTEATEGTSTKKGTIVTVTARALLIDTTGDPAIPRARQSTEAHSLSATSSASISAGGSGSFASGAQVTMIEPLAGFETDTEFTLNAIDEAGMLQSLRSVRDTSLRFVVSPAAVFFASYRDSLTDVIAAPVANALDVAQAHAELELYVMLTIGTSLTDTTANLRAPLVIDHVSGKAVQVILDDDTLPLRQPLPTE